MLAARDMRVTVTIFFVRQSVQNPYRFNLGILGHMRNRIVIEMFLCPISFGLSLKSIHNLLFSNCRL